MSADQAVVALQPQMTLKSPRLEFQVPSPCGWLPMEWSPLAEHLLTTQPHGV